MALCGFVPFGSSKSIDALSKRLRIRWSRRTPIVALESKLKALPLPRGLRRQKFFYTGLWSVGVLPFQSVKQTDIDDAVIELFRRAKEFHGDYEGWETEIVWQ
jgi:Regulator of ribonuclease activity B